MAIGRILLYLVLGILAFVVASTVISLLFTAIAIAWAIATAVATLALLGAAGYGVFKLYQLFSGSSSPSTPSPTGSTFGRERETTSTDPASIQPESRVDRIKERYASGEISEREMERMLEREMDTGERDSIDRELQRDRL